MCPRGWRLGLLMGCTGISAPKSASPMQRTSKRKASPPDTHCLGDPKSSPRPVRPQSCPKNMAPGGQRRQHGSGSNQSAPRAPKPLVSVVVYISSPERGPADVLGCARQARWLLTSVGSLGRWRGLLLPV